MHMRINRCFQQPQVGIVTGAVAMALLSVAWMLRPPALTGTHLALAVCLAVAVALGTQYPIRLPHSATVFVGTVPIYLAAVLLPPELALTVVALGKLCGELAIRAQSRMYLSDIATQVGRLMVVAYAGSLIAHLSVGPLIPSHTLPLLGAALAMGLGDILTSPLLLSPINRASPLTVILTVAREAGPGEAAHYVVGVLGALAAMQSLWSIALLLLPIGLVYLAFKSAKDMHESARQMLASVVETSTHAIALLDLDGSVILANRQAAALYGYSQAEELTGIRLLDLVADDDRSRAEADMRGAFDGAIVKDRQYVICRDEDTPLIAEMSWSPIVDKRGRLKAVTSMARDITERMHAEQALRDRALHDALTRLPNRTLFQERLTAALARGHDEELPFALFLMDLDRFKQVNDTYGHQHGDLLLQQVARRLRRCVRDSDTIARLGGDEFAVLLPKADAEGARIVAARVQAAIAEPFDLEGLRLDVGVSIGIALYPQHGETDQTLIHRADVTMYRAKRTHAGYTFYDPDQEPEGPPAVAPTPGDVVPALE